MRLTGLEADLIRQAVLSSFGPDSEVWLFGSRVDDSKKGGDIDLLVQPQVYPDNVLMTKIACLKLLQQQLGEQKIDIVIEAQDDNRPIVEIARKTGIKL